MVLQRVGRFSLCHWWWDNIWFVTIHKAKAKLRMLTSSSEGMVVTSKTLTISIAMEEI